MESHPKTILHHPLITNHY